jgi:hypothetical protein
MDILPATSTDIDQVEGSRLTQHWFESSGGNFRLKMVIRPKHVAVTK